MHNFKLRTQNSELRTCFLELRTIFICLALFLIPTLSLAQDFTATAIGDYGNVTVMEVSGNYDSKNADDTINSVPRQEIAKEFYKTHKDEYDFIVIYTNFDFQMPDEEAIAFYTGIRNDTQGIGLEIFDNSNLYGSSGKLQGTIDMGNISNLETNPLDPGFRNSLSTLDHELLHRWAANVTFINSSGDPDTSLLGKDGDHWSFLLDSDGSVLYGNDWQDNGDGTFTSAAARKYYSPLDLYLMGFYDKSQVPQMLLIDNAGIDPARPSETGTTIDGTAQYITIDDITAAEGERIPGPTESQKPFKTAFILITTPDSFTGYEIYGIENIRNGWITRFSILTDGQGIMQVALSPKEDLPYNPGVIPPSVEPRVLPPDIDEGVAWLMNNQGIDGSWMDLPQTMVRDTAGAVLALKNFSVAQPNYSSGLLWLGAESSGNMDYLSRKIETMAGSGQDVTALIDELLARQNADGGWGSNNGYESNPLDTSFALKSLAGAGYSEQSIISNAIEYLKLKQNTDSGWGSDDEESNIRATANALSAFNKYKDGYQLDDRINSGISWLLSKQNPDGGFGNSPSTVYDSAVAALVLREFNISSDITNNALNYILNLQSDNGSWYESPYQTALAVSAVWKATIDSDLSITTDDITFIPSTVMNLPSNVVINAEIWNLGRTDVPQAKVKLYEGAVSEENKIGEQIIAFPGQSSVTVTFSATITDGNEHGYYISVDPENLVKEPNESNNIALKQLSPQATYDFEIPDADISVSVNPVDIFQDVTISAAVTNRGTMDAYNVQLKYYIDEAEGPFDIATATVDIPAGATITNEIIWRTNKAGENLPVTIYADPFDSFAELSETNNQAVISLTVNAATGPNLTISYKDIVFTPDPADELGSVNVSAIVKNQGFSEASNINVNFYKGVPGEDGVLLGTQIIPSLNAGESSTVSLDWMNIMDSGERIIYIRVDPDNLTPEISEEDNDAFTTLKILSLPDFAVSTYSISFNPLFPKDGDIVSIAVTMQNSGEQDAKEVLVKALEGNTLIGSQAVPIIPGLSQANASFVYDTTGKPGVHEITVIVDPDNTITEISEDNNRASRAFGVQDANLWLTEQYISPNGDGVKDSTQFFFRLDVPQTVRIVVVNDKGETVRTFSGSEFENTTGGSITWDGLDDDGMVVNDGQYQIRIVDINDINIGSLLVIVDNNRSSLTNAIGTKYLLNNNLTCMQPDLYGNWQWFPDESGILFNIAYPDRNTPEYPAGLYTMSPDGEDILRLVPWEWTQGDDPTYDYYFKGHELSPDGEKVVFILEKYNKDTGKKELSQLWVVDSDGENLTLLDSYDLLLEYTPVRNIKWSPDSSYIVYNSYYTDELWLIRPDGTGKTKIDNVEYVDFRYLTWSPDSSKVAYIYGYYDTDRNYFEKIRITDTSGNKEDIFQVNDYVISIEWLNNQKIVLAEEKEVNSIRKSGLWLADASGNGNHIKVAADLNGLSTYVSPDRQSIAFRTRNPSYDTVYVNISDTDGNVYTLHEFKFTDDDYKPQIGIIFWSPDSNRLSFTESVFLDCVDCTIIPGLPGFESPYPEPSLVVVNIKTEKEASFSVSSSEMELVGWLSDNISIIGQDFSDNNVYVINSGTGEQIPLLSDVLFEKLISPLERYITYSLAVEPASVCYGRGYSDLWAMSSLLNLTADLRAIKEKSAVILRGIAADLNFEGYMLEYADIKSPDVWNLVSPPSDIPVINDVFTTWVPPYEGTFYVKLTVWDKAGNESYDLERVSWGLYSSITNIYKNHEIFSPNGDGIKDTVELNYRVLEPVHLDFNIYDKDNSLIRTIQRDYTSPVDDFITWDGRDSAGKIMPDGKYRIKVLSYEFFVEVDTTPPDAGIVLRSMTQDVESLGIYVELTGHAVDNKIKSWVVDYGEGDNPGKWFELKKGNDILTGKDNEMPSGPAQDTPIINFGSADIEWLINKKFRISVEDFAGNRSARTTDFLREDIILYMWDGMEFNIAEDFIALPVFAGLHEIGVIGSIKEQLVSMTVQYSKGEKDSENEIIWYDDKTVDYPSSGRIDIRWDDSHLGFIDSRRVKAVDILGIEYFSNELRLITSEDDEDPLDIGLDLEVEYNEAIDCGFMSSDKANLSATFNIGRLPEQGFEIISLTYYIQDSSGDWNILKSSDSIRSVQINTNDFDEGVYPVRATLTYINNGSTQEISAANSLFIDRVFPTAQITYPGESLMLCPLKVSDPEGDWYGIPVEGMATDNIQVKRYELYYGIGENPDKWLPAMTRKEGKSIPVSGEGSIQGQIGIWDVTNLKGATFSLKLKVVDIAGNVACYTTPASLSIDTVVEIANLSTDKSLFSPNGDEVFDDLEISYKIDEYATVDVKVFKLIETEDGSYILDSLPLRAIESGLQHLAGTEKTSWDGTDDSGVVVPDGKYGISVFATDACGNTRQRWMAVEVDNTPPAINISYPMPDDPLGNIVEVRGTAADDHFQSYTLEFGEGAAPEQWTYISSKTTPAKNDILGKWNTFNLNTGIWTLRLTAADTVGNSSSTSVTVDLTQRKDLIKNLDAAPKLFSPNNDSKLDTTNIKYELTDASDITIEIFDSGDALKKTYTTTTPSPGEYTYTWDGKDDEGIIVPDGDYSVKLTAVLSSDTSVTQEEAITVIVDATAPVVDITQPEADSYFSADLIVNGTISDENLLEYSITYTGEAGTELLDSAGQSREDYTFGILNDFPEGSYTLNIEAKDSGENITVKTIVFTIDRTPPKAALETPEEGEYYGSDKNIINIIGSIEEKNIETYSLRYGSGESPPEWTELLTGDTLPVAPQLFEWKVGKDDGIPDGLYTLSLYARDKANFENEAKVRITIDNTPPEVLITSLQAGSYVKETVDVKGTAFDRNLDNYTVEFSEGNCSDAFKWASIKKAGSSVQDGALATWQTLPPDNDYCLRLTAVDEPEQKAEAKVNVKVDTHPPAVPELSGEVENKTGAKLIWTQNTEPDIAGYNLYRDNQKVNSDFITDIGYLDQGLNEGIFTYTVKAVDLAGWESEPSNEVKVTIDLTGPDARISSPDDGSKVSGFVEVKGTAYSSDDFRQYRVYIGRGAEPSAWSIIRTSPVPTPYNVLTQWDTTGLGEGEVYSIRLETEDISGNINTGQISVTIDNTPPAGPLLISAVPDNSDVTLTWEANTESDLAGYLLYRNDQLVNVPGIVTGDLKPYLLTGTTYSDEALPDGRFKYYLAAMDSAGNISVRSNTIEVNIDTHPPQALIVEPEDSFKLEDTILIRAESPDLDITSIQFEYKKVEDADWINLGDAVTTQPYMTSLNPVSLVLIYGDYNLRAVAVDGGGQTDPSPSFITVTYTDLTAPEAPVDLNALTNGQDVTLAWTANTEADLDGYNIYRTSGETKTRINTEIVKDITYIDSGLPDGTYEYEITAIDIYGNESPASGSVPAKIYAPLIEQPYTPAGENVVLINGSDAETDSTVEIYVEDVSGYGLRVTTFSDSMGKFSFDANLAPGENRIIAKVIDSNGNISRASDEVVIVYNEPPAAPAGLAISVEGYNVTLTWDTNTEPDLSGYNLYRDEEKVNLPSAITSGSTTASSYSSYSSRAFDSDLSTYWYVHSYGYPVWWQIDLSSPELINHIEMHWASEEFAGKDYEIQVWSGYAWITQATVTGNNTIDNAFDFSPPYRTDKIRIYITDTTDTNYSKQIRLSEVEILKDNLITDASYDDVDLDDGEYAYKVTAVDYYGFESLPSDDTQADVGDVTPPSSPLNLSANASGSDITLNWTANSEPDLSGYNIYRNTPEGWIKINMSIVTAPTYTDQNLANGTYTYRITAVDNAGNESNPSNEASADVNIALLPPPVNLSVSPVPEGEALSATWAYESGPPAGYNIYKSAISGGPYTKINDSLIGELTYVDSGLTNGAAYYYVVVAVDSSGNESAYSNEAVGMPGDITPPSKPEMFLSGECSVRFEEMIDISGSSEQGVTIELYKDGEFAGRVVPLEADVFQDISFDFYLYDASLSSDGKTFAYSDNNSLWLMDISTGSAKQFNAVVYEPLWSLDGRKIAYIFYDRLWNSRIGIYDVDSGTGAPLTADTENYFDESNPSWSSDGNIIVFVSNIGGYYDIRLKDLSVNTLTQVTNGINTYNPKISPDGGKITYFVDSTLYIVEIESGLTTEVDADTDGESIAWSPDSGELAFISYQKGPADLYVFNLSVQSLKQITNDSGVESKPAWSPDGASIVFERRQPDWSRSVAVVNTRSMESRILNQVLYSLYYLDWTASGKIAYVEQKTLFTAELKGDFKFSDIQMDPGENIFYVQAVDPSGNARASDEVCVIYDTSLVPDPEITTEDIFIYPPYPVEGEEVSVIVTVKNKAQYKVDDVDVDIYVWDPAGNLELVHSETLPYIAAGSEQLISLGLVSTGRSGVNTVIAVIDPEDKIHELSETNNYASREFVVVEEEGVSMTTTIDSEEYESNEDVNIDVALINSGIERDVIVEVRIEDENGDAVTLLDTINTRLEYGLKKNYDFVWNTGSSYAGSYRVHSIHKDDTGVISENIVPFTLLPDINIDLTVVTDKTDYDVGEDVLMYINVKNSGNNYAVPELTAKVKITDINSNEQFTDNTTVTNLLPGVTVSLDSVWNTGSGAPGDYTAFVELYVDGRPVESESASFGLNGSIKIAGSITATPPVVSLGNDVYADYTVRNNGSVDADGLVLKVLVMDPETQAVINTFEDVRDLAVDSAQTGRFVFSSVGYELKTYSVVFQYSSQEGTGRIDSASFTVRDGTPPAVSVLSPVPGGYYTSTVSISALVSDNASGVDKVEYQLDDGLWRLLPLSDLSQGRYSTTWTPGLLSDEGSHSVSVRAYDKSGNISEPVVITFTLEFIPPVAYAGPDRNVITGEFVILDGSGSYDPEGETITFLWMFTEAPAASAVTDESLSDVTSAKPAFTPDVDGTYVLELTVSDGKKQDSDTVSINATTPNVPPNADAGPDRNVFTGNVVYLDGSGSNDPDNGPMPLSYNWSFDVLPPESGLSDNDIIDKEQVNASFIPDADGSYILKLVVNDGVLPSEDYVIITAATPNVPPNADAGDDITVSLGETAILDGSASNDPDNGPGSLAYSWSFVAVPADSDITNSDLFDADTASPSFIPDTAGTYVLELMIEDGLEAAFDNVAVTVVDVPIISVSPTSIDFGDLDIGLYSDPQAITVLNESSIELVISDINISGADQDEFSQTNDCTTIGAGSTCAINVIFSPGDTGIKNALLGISSNDPDTPSIFVPLSGKGVDITPPEFISVTVNRDVLWPPNHKMVDIVIEVDVTDNSGLPVTLSAAVQSNEPVNGQDDGNTSPDWTEPVIDQATGTINLQLRAERSGRGTGRIYTITIIAVDTSGNSTSIDVEVTVPHDNCNC